MKKLLISLLALLLVLCFASCANKAIEPPENPPAQTETEQPANVEETGEAELIQVNIYHLGIITQMDLRNEQTAALASSLQALLETAAEEDSMDSPPESSPNPIQVTAGRTALELVYSHDIELPFKTADAPITARRLLYSIPYIDDDGGLLYVGQEIYEEVPLGKLFDQDLQQDIYNSAADQVERVSFNADGTQVEINGQNYIYEKGENAADISDMIINRMLYRSIAFYLNAYTGNINGLRLMSTSSLINAITAVNDGATTENEMGEETVAHLNKYILADYFLPQIIFAPEFRDDDYAVGLKLNEQTQITICFIVQEDIPLVSSFELMIADPAEAEDGVK